MIKLGQYPPIRRCIWPVLNLRVEVVLLAVPFPADLGLFTE